MYNLYLVSYLPLWLQQINKLYLRAHIWIQQTSTKS